MNILLVEDDKNLSSSLSELLELEGFSVEKAYNSEEFYEKTFKNSYDLYLVDINIPGDDGFKAVEYLKESEDTTPVIFITALTDINSISKGFELGAIDYIKKPFDPLELLLRIKNLFQKNEQFIIYKDIKYNRKRKELFKNGEAVLLGEIQLKLFEKLIKNKNKIVANSELLELLDNQNSNALRVALNKLKKKLDLDIRNIRGRGYILEEL